MENLVTDPAFWRGKRVFLTGHTGFKGAWASLLLRRFGAEVYGFALPPTHPASLFVAARVADDIRQRIGDIRDLAGLRAALSEAQPDIVIHMAAQALVRPSYAEPVETFATNVMGTVHVLEAARQLPSRRGRRDRHQRQVLREQRPAGAASARTTGSAATIPTATARPAPSS